MEIRRFRVTVLTPVHIGTGKTMAPEEYFVQDSRLVRFRPGAVIGRRPPREREAFESLLRAGNLGEAWNRLRVWAAADRASWLYEIAMGPRSSAELGGSLDPSRRRGEVFVLPWNLARKEVIVPGSAVKGALRTAFVNACVQTRTRELGQRLAELKSRDGERWRRTNEVWSAMEKQALELTGRREERDPIDPLQLLRVGDAAVPAEMVRLDRAEVRTLEGNASAQRIQIHCERLLSKADGRPAQFTLEIAIDTDRARDERVRRLLGRRLEWDFLIQAANHYSFGRLEAERRRFAFLGPGAARWLPGGNWWEGGRMLLRLGRFSHFESLSVDGLRDGYNPQRRRAITEGDSRTVVVTAAGAVTFGWVLLEPE